LADLPQELQEGLNGRYALERQLGRGGMATVYLARDLKHDRPVALKVLLPELAASLGPERFQREIRLAARLQHPHILTVHDSGDTAGQLWFTMPYVEGESLRDRLRRERQLPLDDAVRIAREAAQALHYAHEHGVVHRDIKPENLLLTKDGSTLVADFGIARAVSADEHLTQTGMSVGTPAYMSPEQAAGDKAIDARSDVYSLGAVLFEMLAGEPPYTGATAQQIIMKRFTEPVPSVRKVRPSVPEAVDEAVQRALAAVPADRYATAAELARALGVGRWAEGRETTPVTTATPAATKAAPGYSPVRPPVHRRSLIVLSIGFLLGLGVLFAWRRSHAGGDPEAGAPKRLAVLPFENLGDSASEYFADGITDEVRGKLSALPGLEVIASRSSSEYKHTAKRLPEIARELGVDYVLIGKVRWEKETGRATRVRVSPELVALTGSAPTTRWQQPFDASLTDVFQVQADIAGRVAEALNVALGASQRETLKQRPTANLAAYDAYLKGEAASQGIGVIEPGALRRAITYYEQAIALDSTFLQAWAQLARANAWYYAASGIVTPAAAEGAKRAADRAAQLGSDRPEAQLAVGDYYANIRGEPARALSAYEAGLRSAPDNADLLTASALVEQSLGRWDASLAHLKRANELDPRAVLTARRLAMALNWMRRYSEALPAADRALALAPTNLAVVQTRAVVELGQGNLEGARAVIRAVPSEVEPTAVAAYFAVYGDAYWVLDDAGQELLLRLPPSAFDGSRANWGLALAQTWYLRGNREKARAYADSARVSFEEILRANPEDPQQHALLGVTLAILGRKAEAIREGQRAVELLPLSKDAFTGTYLQHQLARIYVLTGEPDKALDQLEPLLKVPYHLSAGSLRVDPNFAPLRRHPRFQALIGTR
jgi:serine/threonine-protein kinase